MDATDTAEHGWRLRIPLARLAVALPVGIALTLAQGPASAQAQNRAPARVALVVDGPGAGYRELAAGVRSEMSALLGDNRPLTFVPEGDAAFQDFQPATVARALDRAYADPDVDLVIAVGIIAARNVADRGRLAKPTILPVVPPPALADVPMEGDRSGRANLNYVLGVVAVARDLARFRELVAFEHLAAVYDAHVVDALPRLPERLRELADDAQVTVVPLDGDPEAVVAALPDDVDAAYLGGVPGTSPEALDALVEALTARGIPTFATAGPAQVRRGAFATITPERDWVRRARRVALHAERVLDGEPPGSLPIGFDPGEQLVINLGTARRLNVYPSFAVLTEAQLINEERTTAPRELGMTEVIERALERNLDLEAARAGVDAGAQDVVIARAPLLPSLSVSAGGRVIDEDRASPIQAGGAESVISWSGEASQVLFDELAWTGFRAQERRQEAVERDYDGQRLDIIEGAATAYLDVLRAKNAERIQRENLELTRANLSLARIRRRVGTAGPNEVYRFEIQVATNRADVIRAIAVRNQAELELNQILAREPEAAFVTEDIDLASAPLLSADERIDTYFDHPQQFRVLRDFLARESVRNAPELAEVDALLAAERRNLEGRERSLWAPSVALQGTVQQFFWDGGAGADEQVMLPPELGGTIPIPDDWNWTVGVSVSLPLYLGNERYGRIDRSRAQLRQLEAQRASAALAVESRLRAAVHQAGASRAAVDLLQQAADSARANLEVVTDAYQRGAADIITLVDAQNQAVTQELAAANAVYDFLRDFVAVERALGRFEVERSEDERDDLFERLTEFERERSERPVAGTPGTRRPGGAGNGEPPP